MSFGFAFSDRLFGEQQEKAGHSNDSGEDRLPYLYQTEERSHTLLQ